MCKKVFNKSFSDLNYLQKTQWAHMSISHWSGARGIQRYGHVRNIIMYGNGKIGTSGLNAAKNTKYNLNNSYLTFFACNRYFRQHLTPRSIYFCISVHYSISNVKIFQAPSSTLVKNRHVRPLIVFVGNFNMNNFYLKLFV